MKKLALPLLFLSLTTFAHEDYKLVNFSQNRIRTVDEILKETSMTKEQLEVYKCDNQDRYELFAFTPIQNMAMDSLKIVDGTKVYTYQDGTFYDAKNKKLKKVRGSFLKQALKTLNRFITIPETRRLVEELQASPYPFYIKLGGNRYSPNLMTDRPYLHGNNAGFVSALDELQPIVDGFPFNQIGFGGIILWNPATDASFMEDDNVQRKIDTDIILAHEMYHAYDGMRGLLDRRFVESQTLEFQPVCEFRAVRLENILRKGLGYRYRKFYSYSEGSSKDMLDDNGEPVVLPTPCIKWIK